MRVHDAFVNYTTTINGVSCYFAGLPGYPRNFSRDTILSGIIAVDQHLLDNQLSMSSLHQGTEFEPLTGQEPGKIHHEFPSVSVREPFESTYNACDTTALYLIGLEFLGNLSDSKLMEFKNSHRASIESALEYIFNHIHDDIFWDYPPENADRYSLRITYWKDSILPSVSGKEEPTYPVNYALAHFQAARGILAAANLLNREDLREIADIMFSKGINRYIREKSFCVAEDADGRFEQVSSDEMHALAYIPADYSDRLPIESIRRRGNDLVTAAGIACTPKTISDTLMDTYHGYVVWVYEQAMIHYGSEKFGLDDIASITERCVEHIDTGHELLATFPKIVPKGNSHQLWSVAAKIYFSDAHSLRQTKWL